MPNLYNRGNSLKTSMKTVLLALVALAMGWGTALAQDPHGPAEHHHVTVKEEEFEVSKMLFHHVMETHNWHIASIPTGGGHYYELELNLPWFFYDPIDGFQFMYLPHDPIAAEKASLERGYVVSHEKIYAVDKSKQVMDATGTPAAEYQKYFIRGEDGHWKALETQHDIIHGASHTHYVVKHPIAIDLSVSKTPLQMIIVAVLMILVFTAVAKGYRTNEGKAPKGVQSFFEPLIIFVRDEIAKPNLHGKHERFVPYLLTLFFFIWFSNMFGLTPLNSNIAGNISITAALAVLTLILTVTNGSKDYWLHIFWFPGVPLPVKFMMLPVELMGIFTKPFSLTIRLFANISAGHFMVLALISLIFIMGKAGESVGGALGAVPLSFAFTLFIFTLELLVAAVQAYVFTLLTAVFIGQALETHDHHDHAHDHGHAEHAHAH